MANQPSYPYSLPYDVRRSQSSNAQQTQYPSIQHSAYSQFPDAGCQPWTYSQSPTSPISPVSPTSIGAHKTYTLAGALSPRPKSRQHPSASSSSAQSSAAKSHSDPIAWSARQQQQQPPIQHASSAPTAYVNTGPTRSNSKPPAVPFLSQPHPPIRSSMNVMRAPSHIIDEEELDGDYVVEDFHRPSHYDEPGTTFNAGQYPATNLHHGQLNVYQPVPSPAPELQYPAGVSGTPTDFLLGFGPASRPAHQAAFEIWQESVQMQQLQLQQQQSSSHLAYQIPAHMQQQQFRQNAPANEDLRVPFVPAVGADFSAGTTVSKGLDFLAASSLASPTLTSGRSVPAQNNISAIQKGKGKEREHASLPAMPSDRTSHPDGKGSSSSFSAAQFRPSGQGAKDAKANAANVKEQYKTVKVDQPSSAPGEPPKKVKMHQCPVCEKLFPRPSGLDTHMNSHSGARPFKCPLELCSKTFAVRSNARRHLKTHGITLPGDGDGKDDSGKDEYHVGFEEPVVIDVHDIATDGEPGGDGATSAGQRGRPKQRRVELRWVPPSLAGRVNAARLRSLSPASDMADVDGPDGEDEDEEDNEPSAKSGAHARGPARGQPPTVDLAFSRRRRPGLHVASTPLHPVQPTDAAACGDVDVKYEERDSYAEAGVYPYHPKQQRTFRH